MTGTTRCRTASRAAAGSASRDDTQARSGQALRNAESGKVGEVIAIYLAPDSWGKGLGRELMTAALTHLGTLGYNHVTLWVLDTNARARRFYEAAGFRLDGAIKVDDSLGFPLREARYRLSLG